MICGIIQKKKNNYDNNFFNMNNNIDNELRKKYM